MSFLRLFPSYVLCTAVILSSLTAADIVGKLNEISEKEAGNTRESPLVPLLVNISEVVQNIRDNFEKWHRADNFHRRVSRQSISGCELIPTDSTNDEPLYFFCERELNWYMAERHCVSHGMRLATVDTEAIYNKLAPFTKNYLEQKGYTFSGLWIGGSDLGAEGTWYWVTSGKYFTWNKWPPGEPTNNYQGQREDCLTLWKFPHKDFIVFNDFVCDLKKGFICELA